MGMLDGILPSLDDNGQGGISTPADVARRRQMAMELQKSGMDYSPIKSPWQGAARMAQALLGAYGNYQADQQQKNGHADALAQSLQGLNLDSGNVDIPSGTSSPALSQLDATQDAQQDGTAPPPSMGFGMGGVASPAMAGAPQASQQNMALAGALGAKGGNGGDFSGMMAQAGGKYGVSPAYLSRMVQIESQNNPNAHNPSGAAGLAQFMPSTAKQYGLANPYDPAASIDAGAHLAADNSASLQKQLGRAPTDAELYLAHQQGAGGAAKLLANPNAPASSIVGQQAVVQNGGTPDMTAGQFAGKWINKFNQGQPQSAPAMALAGAPAPAPAQAAISGAISVPGYEGKFTKDQTNEDESDDETPSKKEWADAAAKQPAGGNASPGGAQASAGVPASPVAHQQAATPNGLRYDPAQLMQIMQNPWSSPQMQQIAGAILQQQMQAGMPRTPVSVASGSSLVDPGTGHVVYTNTAADATKLPNSVQEYQYYKKTLPAGQEAMPYDAWSTAKSRAGATNISNNVDMKSGETYDQQLAQGLGKAHAGLANGVEDAQTRARDLAAMQGAIDAIQKNGGTTGIGTPEMMKLQSLVNTGANALGIDQPFDISDKEFLTKFNRSIAGAQAKNSVGSRVTNFEMSNYIKANAGLEMSPTGNQRLIGIQSQVEQRNIAVGNGIRELTAKAISSGKKVDPIAVQKLITDYDAAHHISDPVTGQDLTQSYALPEFQQGANAPMATGHEQIIDGIRIKRVK